MELKEIIDQWEFRVAFFSVIVFGMGFVAGSLVKSDLFILSWIGWIGIGFIGSGIVFCVVMLVSGIYLQLKDTKHSKEFIRKAIMEKIKREQEEKGEHE
jgi:hypothetical protein